MRHPLVVMYHYVWPDGDAVPAGIRPLLVSEFAAQLDWLEERYEIVGAERFLERMGEESSRPPCLLTFDDATRDHARVVTPLLSQRSLSGVFLALAWPARDRRMPLTHAIHWLLSQGEQPVWEMMRRFAVDQLGDASHLGDAEQARRVYYYETPLRARIKYAANMALPPDVTERLVGKAVADAGRTMEQLAGEWFASADELVQMHRAGMTIGMHGVSHRTLQALGGEGIGREIAECSAWLTGLLGERPGWFACPFGGSGAAREATAAMDQALRDKGVQAAVTAEKAVVGAGCDRLRIPRLDAIDLPPRRAEPVVAL
jgi:peptidoglycan/xylan/chitin deacetylase (PgdA/CDA1 family)